MLFKDKPRNAQMFRIDPWAYNEIFDAERDIERQEIKLSIFTAKLLFCLSFPIMYLCLVLVEKVTATPAPQFFIAQFGVIYVLTMVLAALPCGAYYVSRRSSLRRSIYRARTNPVLKRYGIPPAVRVATRPGATGNCVILPHETWWDIPTWHGST